MKDLLVTVEKKFRGIFIWCIWWRKAVREPRQWRHQGSEGTKELCEEPFNDDICFIATALDPQFDVRFVDIDVHTENNDIYRGRVKDTINATITAHAENPAEGKEGKTVNGYWNGVDEEAEENPPPAKIPRLLSKYTKKQSREEATCTTANEQTKKILKLETEDVDSVSVLHFWSNQGHKYSLL